MRCFEIRHVIPEVHFSCELNNNMRCFEMRIERAKEKWTVSLNNNMRCFEIQDLLMDDMLYCVKQ